MSDTPTFGGDTTRAHKKHTELARRYDAGLAIDDLKYPSSPSRPKDVCMAIVSQESGIPYEVLAHKTSIRCLVIGLAVDRGIEPRMRSRLNREHSIVDLRKICAVRLEEEHPGDDALATAVSDIFDRMTEALGGGAKVAPLLEDDRFAASSRADAADYVRVVLHDAQRGIGSPQAFAARMVFECALRGISPAFIAFELGLRKQNLERWAMGIRRPTTGAEATIHRIESFLGLEQGELWSLVSHKRMRRGHVYSEDLPAHLCQTRGQKDKLRKLLPDDFSFRSADERAVLIEEAEAEIKLQSDSSRGRIAAQRRDEYVLKAEEMTPRLRQEFEALRANRRPAVLPFNDLGGDGWNEQSFRKWKHRFCGFLGFLMNRLHELQHVEGYRPQDIEGEAAPYVNIPAGDLTLAFAAVPDLVIAYERWLNWRKEQFGRAGKPTPDDIEFICELERMTRPRRKASFEDRLRARNHAARAAI